MTNQEVVNWVTVLNFLQKEQMMSTAREKEWSLQKYQLLQKIKRLEAELDGNKIIITDLLNRIKLLQIALFQIKAQKGKGNYSHFKDQDFSKVQSLLSKFHLEQKVQEGDDKQFLNKILTQIGIDSKEVFAPHNLPIPEEILIKKEFNLKIRQTGSVTAHLDAVRGIFVNDTKDFIVTVSEDCLVKVWPYQAIVKNKYDYIQPSKTFRQHAGPLLSIDGGLSPFNPQQSIFFTGGSDGLIKYWKIGNKTFQHDTLSPISAWSCSKNTDKDVTVWDLSLNSNKLLCSASDGFINYYEIGQSEGSTLKNSFREKQFNPTCVTWISQQAFIQGCSNAPRGQIWNIEGKVKQKFLYDIPKGSQAEHHQINTICYNKNMKMSIFGCEDGALRIFALNFNRLLQKITVNSSISCIKLMKDWQIVCGNHQGGLSVYDLRNYQKIMQYEKCHLKKYDEGTLCLWSGEDKILSGGTDGLIKIFS